MPPPFDLPQADETQDSVQAPGLKVLQHAPGRWIVEGSEGKEYHVKQWGWSFAPDAPIKIAYVCDCPGSIYGKECKHIKAVKANTTKAWNFIA